jgi:beta-glucuronidase
MKQKLSLLLGCIGLLMQVSAQTTLINNVQARAVKSLDGKWQYIVDPYETGFYDYRYKELNEKDAGAYWNSDVPINKSDRKEFGYADKYTLNVPGDWNSQQEKFLYYEGTVWYKKTFDYKKSKQGNRIFLYFGAVNYKADVYLNGHKLGEHKGGFTAFNFEIKDDFLKEKNNVLVVKVDNKRYADEVPTLNTDWWNYGGITRSVQLVEVPENFIQDYVVQLSSNGKNIEGLVEINGQSPEKNITIEIPELNIKQQVVLNNNQASISIEAAHLQKWSPENPKCYRVILSSNSDRVVDKIGFRNIEVKGKQVLLNGKPIFMRGICVHAEIPQEVRRAYSKKDAALLLGWAKELECNMVRLAHYPHDENMTRLADSLGLLVWSEIPVYWTIDFKSDAVLEKAKAQLREMIARDKNRASIIIWSVGNETPVSDARTKFMSNLIATVKSIDSSRIVSAALEVNYNVREASRVINDPLGQYVDMVAFNEYLGWYGGIPSDIKNAKFSTVYDKPLFISETGAEALSDFKADSLTRFSENYQTWFYKEQIKMLHHMPDNFVGISPWILADFKSPKRNNPVYQEGWNNKGLIDHHGKKKPAFYILKAYYTEMKQRMASQTK